MAFPAKKESTKKAKQSRVPFIRFRSRLASGRLRPANAKTEGTSPATPTFRALLALTNVRPEATPARNHGAPVIGRLLLEGQVGAAQRDSLACSLAPVCPSGHLLSLSLVGPLSARRELAFRINEATRLGPRTFSACPQARRALSARACADAC